MAHLNIFTIDDLLECMMELVLEIKIYRILMTQPNNRIPKRSPSEVPILIV